MFIRITLGIKVIYSCLKSKEIRSSKGLEYHAVKEWNTLNDESRYSDGMAQFKMNVLNSKPCTAGSYTLMLLVYILLLLCIGSS